jgi:GDP/UDP-N,N'-diacetylbacillosamine 2-epimerase (hydrolysing)
MRRVCYVSGTRADFGLMQATLAAIDSDPALALSMVVTGMHLAPEFGLTVGDIERAGLPVSRRIALDMLPASGATMARNIGRMLTEMTGAFEELRPDLVLLLGDRGEMLAGALAAIHLDIPIVHIHGGERSGTVDEPVRHAISKLSHFHFTATEEAAERLRRMGERADNIHVTGAPGLDGLTGLVCATRAELCAAAGFDAALPVALMVYHPVLQEAGSGGQDTRAIVDALLARGVRVMALMPNADAGSDAVRAVLDSYADDPRVALATHLPRPHFVSWLAHADLMIGNSSAGIIEAASFGTPVINIGSRQGLRERNTNVADAAADGAALAAAIGAALAGGRSAPHNRYGDGRTAARIAALLAGLPLAGAALVKTNDY